MQLNLENKSKRQSALKLAIMRFEAAKALRTAVKLVLDIQHHGAKYPEMSMINCVGLEA